tara:strand:+ start:1166 stop:2269 length:1104 start_codon:yes stop_codon:yes gene_type:complete
VIAVSFVAIDFPREVLELPSSGERGWRRIVRDATELERYWAGKNGSGNVYFTAYGFNKTQAPKHHRVDYNTPKIHHFVLDFDCKDFKSRGKDVPFEVPQAEVRKLHRYLIQNDTLHYIWFSGGGYHVWVPLSETLEPKNGNELSRIKHSGRLLINKWENKLGGLRCNDPAVAFDTSGMIRIPNSYNAKREVWGVPLSSELVLNASYDDLMDIGQEPHSGYVKLGNTPITLTVVKSSFANMTHINTVDIPTVSLDDIHMLPCLSQAAMGGGNPTHRARFHLASYLADRLRMFFPAWRVAEKEKEEHVGMISRIISGQGWVDYNKDKTEEQVRSIVMAGYPHATCSTLFQEGFCVGKCIYYDGTGDMEE